MEYMDGRIIAFLMLGIVLVAAAGCTGTQPSEVTATTTPAQSPEPTQIATTASATTPAPDTGSCTSEGDCVPAQCCHPTSCTLKTNAPSCDDIMCTAVCQGPLDCGAGSCECVDGTCGIKSLSHGGSIPVIETPSLTIDASPPRYSPVMSSTPGVKLVPNATGFSISGATFNWTATNGQFISWGAPDYTIHVLGNPATSTTETVYWTFTGHTSTPTIPVIITVVATDPASSSILGNGQVTLTWDGSYTVVVGENA